VRNTMPAKQATTAKPAAKAAPKKESAGVKKEVPKKEASKKPAAKPAAKGAPKKAAAKPAAPKKDATKKPAAKPAAKKAPAKPAAAGGKKAPAKPAAGGKKAPAKPAAAGGKKVAAKKPVPAGPAKGIKKGVKTAGTQKKGVSPKVAQLVKSKRVAKKPITKFFIDCKQPVEDGIMDPANFEKFLHDRFKVSTGTIAKPGVLGDKVSIGREKARLHVTLHHETRVPKHYLKYLTKKYLKKQQLRDWLRVISNTPNTYELRYYNIQENEESGDESEDES